MLLCTTQLFRGGSRTTATSKMERFVIIVNGWKPLTIITKRSILDVAAVLDPPLAFDCSFADYYDFCDNIRDVPWEGKLDFGASVVIIEFCG